MYLNNSKANFNIYNSTISIIIDVDIETNLVQVSFNVPDGIIDINIDSEINYFTINRNHASHHQFSLQNCYTLTVYKTQGLTLNQISVSLDSQIFSTGQAYVILNKITN